jgi:uncharacterized protein YndB with AHSA1/START domain
MPTVSHTFVCDGRIEQVFDVVTTARFWPYWHPATRRVEGDVDAPAQLGDRITEHVVIAGVEGAGTWTVTERDRPHHLALEAALAAGNFRITYDLSAEGAGQDGTRTRMRRELHFPELGPAVAAAMTTQSGEGMAHLRRLVGQQLATAIPPSRNALG